MKLEELRSYPNFTITDFELVEEDDGFKYYFAETNYDGEEGVNVTVDNDNEIVEFSIGTDSWYYPEGCCGIRDPKIVLEGDDIKYLPKALDFVTNPLDMAMEVLSNYIHKVRKFLSKFQVILEDKGWHCDFESCTSFAETSTGDLCPWFSFMWKNGDTIDFKYNVWEDKLIGYDIDDVTEMTVYDFKEWLEALMKKRHLTEEDLELFEKYMKERNS